LQSARSLGEIRLRGGYYDRTKRSIAKAQKGGKKEGTFSAMERKGDEVAEMKHGTSGEEEKLNKLAGGKVTQKGI